MFDNQGFDNMDNQRANSLVLFGLNSLPDLKLLVTLHPRDDWHPYNSLSTLEHPLNAPTQHTYPRSIWPCKLDIQLSSYAEFRVAKKEHGLERNTCFPMST